MTGQPCDDGTTLSHSDMLSKGVCWGLQVFNPPPTRNGAANWTTHPVYGFHITCREITVAAHIDCSRKGARDLTTAYPVSFDHRCTYGSVFTLVENFVDSTVFEKLNDWEKIILGSFVLYLGSSNKSHKL